MPENGNIRPSTFLTRDATVTQNTDKSGGGELWQKTAGRCVAWPDRPV